MTVKPEHLLQLKQIIAKTRENQLNLNINNQVNETARVFPEIYSDRYAVMKLINIPQVVTFLAVFGVFIFGAGLVASVPQNSSQAASNTSTHTEAIDNLRLENEQLIEELNNTKEELRNLKQVLPEYESQEIVIDDGTVATQKSLIQ